MTEFFVNPFTLMQHGKVFHPDPPRDYSHTGTLNVPLGAGETRVGRVHLIQGAPGIGKTTRLISDYRTLSERNWEPMVTAQSKSAMYQANSRLEKEGEVGEHKTIHSLVWDWLGKSLSSRIVARREKRPRYLDEPFDAKLVEQYLKDANYQAKGVHRDNHSDIYRGWDPTTEPKPELLAEAASLPNNCAYLHTLELVCRKMEERMAEGDLWALRKTAGKYAHLETVVLVDEAQEMCPLEALALGWWALDNHAAIRIYGDRNQDLHSDRLTPFLWDQHDSEESYYGTPHMRRCTLSSGRLCELVLPGQVPPAAEWCNPTREGVVIPYPTKGKRERIPSTGGYVICDTRWGVTNALKAVPPFVKPGATDKAVSRQKELGLPHVVVSTAFQVKGGTTDSAIIQRWSTNSMNKYLMGDPSMRKQLFVALSRTTDRLIIHPDMLDMIQRGADFRWN